MTKEAHEKATDLFNRLDQLKSIQATTKEKGLLYYWLPNDESETKKRLESLALQYLDECIKTLENEIEKL